MTAIFSNDWKMRDRKYLPLRKLAFRYENLANKKLGDGKASSPFAPTKWMFPKPSTKRKIRITGGKYDYS